MKTVMHLAPLAHSTKSIRPDSAALLCALLGTLCAALAMSPAHAAGPGAKRPVPTVAVAPVFAVTAIARERHPARVVSPAALSVTSRISGEVTEVAFEEGAAVAKNAVLYRLDPVRYEAAVKSARAALADAKAQYDWSKTNLARAKALWEKQAGTREAYDEAVKTGKTAAAAVMEAEAALTLAEDDLRHTVITTPVAGRAGVNAAPVGTWVTAGSGALTTVLATDPMRIRFALSMRDLAKTFGSTAKLLENGAVTVELADGTTLPQKARVKFLANAAAADTDTIDVYAEIDNADGRLVAGTTVAVILSAAAPEGAVGVLPSAVQRDASGPWVWVVAGSRVEKRRVEVADVSNDAAVVTAGLKLGETVVTEGAHKPVDKGEVKTVPDESAAGPRAAAMTLGKKE